MPAEEPATSRMCFASVESAHLGQDTPFVCHPLLHIPNKLPKRHQDPSPKNMRRQCSPCADAAQDAIGGRERTAHPTYDANTAWHRLSTTQTRTRRADGETTKRCAAAELRLEVTSADVVRSIPHDLSAVEEVGGRADSPGVVAAERVGAPRGRAPCLGRPRAC